MDLPVDLPGQFHLHPVSSPKVQVGCYFKDRFCKRHLVVDERYLYSVNTLYKVESSLKSEQSSSNSHQEVDMLDILLPKPVFKWQDPTLVPRFSHGLESEDADYNKIKNGTPRKTLHTIIHRMKFSDGKIRLVFMLILIG